MDELEQKLGGLLNDPEMMGKLMSMAQSLGGSGKKEAPPEGMPDPGMLKQLASLAGQSGIDPRQQSLLRALEPCVSGIRLRKLEKAMRTARSLRMATGLLSAGSPLAGR